MKHPSTNTQADHDQSAKRAEELQEALDSLKTEPRYDAEEVFAWMHSWGSENERPSPREQHCSPKIPNAALEADLREARDPEFKKTQKSYSSVQELMDDLDS